MNTTPVNFENIDIRRVYDEKTEIWFFSVVDIIRALLQQPDFQTARKYWNKLKERLQKEGSESVTNCHRLKLEAADGKKYLTDVASPEVLLRLIQSVPSPKKTFVLFFHGWKKCNIVTMQSFCCNMVPRLPQAMISPRKHQITLDCMAF